MAPMQMVEMQTTIPAMFKKTEKSAMAAPKAKTNSNSSSFNQHLLRLTRSNTGSTEGKKDVAAAESPDKNSTTLSSGVFTKQPEAKSNLLIQKQAEQSSPGDLEKLNQETVIVEEIEQDSTVQEESIKMVSAEIPVLITQENIAELPKIEAGTLEIPSSNSDACDLSTDLPDLLNVVQKDAAQTMPTQENLIPQGEDQKVQMDGLLQAIVEEMDSNKLAADARYNQEMPIDETTVSEDDNLRTQAVPVKQLADKLSTAKQDLAETKPLLNEIIPPQLEMTADKQEKQAYVETGIILDGKQTVSEALTPSEPQAANMVSLVQTGLAGKQIAKPAAPNNAQAADQESEIAVTQTNPGDQKTMISSEADTAAASDKAIQMTANKEAGITQGKNELNYNTAAGQKQEAVTPKTESAATDIKKLIEFESKRPQSGKAEVTQLKNEVALNSEKAEGEASSLLLGRTAMETEKTPILRNVNIPTPADLTAEPEQVLEQLVKKAELMVKLNSSEMKIQLQPEFLGKMTIKIILEEGLVTAKFITDSHQVKHMLESNLNTLKQSLEAQGIRVEKTEVNVQLNNGGMFDGSNHNPQESWEKHQFMSNNYQRNYSEQGYQTGIENDDIPESSILEQDYGIDRNGTMNFLI